jgi:hypothetical protein
MAAVAMFALIPLSTASAGDVRSPDTLWIFDADFEDLVGDNAGCVSEDWSGTPANINYWHKDTLRTDGFDYLGDSTWWCGTYDDCWLQHRGYGNNWLCLLLRGFPEVEAVCETGDELTLEYDQRWAMEACYDYGYTELSTDGGETWTTLTYVTNPGFACSQPGPSQDWDSAGIWGMYGHTVLDLSEYAGHSLTLRFRFESDSIYSSSDQWNNPPMNSCLDGAWQLDNIAWYVNDEQVWLDDCESPGDNGWSTEGAPASGQTGVAYERRYEEFGGHAGWMMAAYDTTTGGMVPGQLSVLFPPPIPITGIDHVVARWEGWLDLPDGGGSDDYIRFTMAQYDQFECAERLLWASVYSIAYLDEEPARWITFDDSVPCYSRDWLVLGVEARGLSGASEHGVGFVVDRMRVGVPLQTGVDGGGLAAWILQPWPSPFSDATSVRYGLAAEGHAVLRIYDLSGRVVRTLVDAVIEAGPHTARWNGTADSGERVASGVYFVKLESDGAQGPAVTRKLVMLR